MQELDFFKRITYSFDRFGTEFYWRIHHHYTSRRSKFGSLLTFIMIVPIIVFAYYKYRIMIQYDETNIIISTHQDYFSQEYTMSTI